MRFVPLKDEHRNLQSYIRPAFRVGRGAGAKPKRLQRDITVHLENCQLGRKLHSSRRHSACIERGRALSRNVSNTTARLVELRATTSAVDGSCNFAVSARRWRARRLLAWVPDMTSTMVVRCAHGSD